jgi:hypothetical protein
MGETLLGCPAREVCLLSRDNQEHEEEEPMQVRRVLSVLAVLVGVGAVLAGASAAGGPAPGVATGGDGVLAPGGAIRYVAYESSGTSIVTAVSTKTGRTLKWKGLPGSYGIPVVAFDGTAGGLTPDGRTLVLGSLPNSSSQFAILDTKKLSLQKTIELKGIWAYDAISPNGKTLYLIEYVQRNNTFVYRVRAYDVAAGRLVTKPVVDPKDAAEPMNGSPVTRATGPGGRWVYTLYARPGAPFIHALDTANRAAVCIDLPWKGTDNELATMRLSLNADGSKLTVQTRDGKAMVVVDTKTHKAQSV